MSLRTAIVAAILTSGLGACGDDLPDAAETGRGSSGAPAGGSDTAAGSSGLAGSDDTGAPPPEVAWPHLPCDPLVPEVCGYPFPNNVFTVDDPATPTGRHVELDPMLPPEHTTGKRADPSGFRDNDGFSTSAAMLAYLPGASGSGLPTPLQIDASLAADAPVLLVEADTGERVPYFAELDATANDPAKRALIIRPVVPLRGSTRYVVAIRGIVDEAGAPVAASPAFAALRDGTPSDDAEAVESRRGLYEDIFAHADAAGFAREDLQLAWDFTTASMHNDTQRLISMRDQALATVGDAGPAYTIDDVTTDVTPEILLRIEGRMSVPLFLDTREPGGNMLFDGDGVPDTNGMADAPFLVLVPRSAVDTPAGVLFVGHGLLGGRDEADSEHYRTFAQEHGWVLVSTDWIGMAEDDVMNIVAVITSGELERFSTVTDRLQQGVLEAVLAVRLVRDGLSADPVLGDAAIDPSRVAYVGSSQGGILGAVLLALSPDLERGILDVPGQPYNLLLGRSVDFGSFLLLLDAGYHDPRDRELVLQLAQMLWDRTEPGGWSRFLVNDPLPGSMAKDVLVQVAIGDHQVSTLGAHVMARAIGAPLVGEPNRELFGIPVEAEPAVGVGMIEYEFGLPPEPIENVPMEEGDDPHGKVRKLAASIAARAQFLETGTIETFCAGPCDPE